MSLIAMEGENKRKFGMKPIHLLKEIHAKIKLTTEKSKLNHTNPFKNKQQKKKKKIRRRKKYNGLWFYIMFVGIDENDDERK